MKTLLISAFVLLIIFLALNAQGYERYHNPSTPGQGYCSACHPGFVGGLSSALHAKHTGGTAPITTNCDLCHTTGSGDNPLTMWSALNGGNGLGCAGCHGRDYGETTTANYGGFPSGGKAKSSTYGLRKHHLNMGVTICLSCHPDVPQSSIKPEHVNPVNFSRTDVAINGTPAYSADNEDTNNDPDNEGLDNDGDLHYDVNDPDCSLTVDTHIVTESMGGTVNFSLDAGSANGNRNYILLASFSGTTPGFPLPGGFVTLPINWDWFTDLEMGLINSPVFFNFMAKLNAGGKASAQLNVPPLPAGVAGLVMHYAFCMNNPFDYASHATGIHIKP